MTLDVKEWNEKLRLLRLSKKWSQYQAAEACGTNQKGYWLWENGKAMPRLNNQKAIAAAFGVSREEIFEEG
jgi:transcriptional regulator with XRE-family HTH domain